MPRRKNQSSPAPEPDVQITSPPEAPSPRDAAAINPDEFPMQPLGLPGREFKFQAIFTQDVIDAIRAHGKTSMNAEICGVLVGNVYRDSHGAYLRVHACIKGDAAESRNAQVTFKAETWTHIQQVMDQAHADAKIVGWYHTHPGFGIFLSGMDLFIQDNFFNLPWQIALVYDPQSEEEGVFVWRQGKSEREQHLIELSSTPVPAELNPSGAGTGKPEDQLTVRTWLLAGILFVLSFGLTYAIIWMIRTMR